MQVSVDGYFEGPGGDLYRPVVQDELHQYFVDELGRALYGRKTYEMTAAFWPTADEDPDGSPQARCSACPPSRTPGTRCSAAPRPPPRSCRPT